MSRREKMICGSEWWVPNSSLSWAMRVGWVQHRWSVWHSVSQSSMWLKQSVSLVHWGLQWWVCVGCHSLVWNIEIRQPYLVTCDWFSLVHIFGPLSMTWVVSMTSVDIQSRMKNINGSQCGRCIQPLKGEQLGLDSLLGVSSLVKPSLCLSYLCTR